MTTNVGGWRCGACPFHAVSATTGSCATKFARDGVVCAVRSGFWAAAEPAVTPAAGK